MTRILQRNAAQRRNDQRERIEREGIGFRLEERTVVIDGVEQVRQVKIYPSTVRNEFRDPSYVAHSPMASAVFGGVQRTRKGSGY